jgi:hypothetical protein
MSRELRIEYPALSLKWIAQRLPMGSWTCVSNLLNEPPQTQPQGQGVLPLCQNSEGTRPVIAKGA